ncbi:MAG: DUF4139 domain-containing protein [Candidatus Latescibacterota bacterium]|nr:MAG: DUF4139 domain-containing protein [Candidatus Latescibacterota bacterium]
MTQTNGNRHVKRIFGSKSHRRIRWGLLLVLGGLILGGGLPKHAVGAQTEKSTPTDQKTVSVTVYNNDLGLVKDVRGLRLPRGVLDLKFEGVAAKIDPTSVHIRSLTHPDDLAVLEQNFEFDLISPSKLMEKYLGHTIELVRMIDEKEVTNQAKLIGIEGGYVYEMDGKIAVNPPGRVVLPELPQGLISKPTLVWMLENGAPEHTVEASYLTGGMNWRSNYVMVLSEDDKAIDLSGWVTIDNRSGATYEDASVKLVAGDVHRVPEPRKGRRLADGVREMQVTAGAPQFEERAFFEYHLYTLQRKSTIKDNQTKQIGLLDSENVSVEKSYLYQPRRSYWFSSMSGPDKTTKVGVFLTLDNSEENGMGMPLPKGVVRVYKKDEDEALQFIGEDSIDHTPKDEKIRVKLGDAFDIVGERVQTRYRVLATGHLYESSYKVTLRNHKDEAVVVSVIEMIPGDWEIIEKSHEYEKESSNRVRFDVPIEENGSAELTYTVRIKY